MSTDYAICCRTCRVGMHMAVRFASGDCVFGHGSSDEPERKRIGQFIVEHAAHAEFGHLLVCECEEAPPEWKYEASASIA